MNNKGNIGISSVIILIALMLVAITALSVLSQDSTTTTETTEEEIEQMLNEALDSATKYIQITDQVGKYYGEPRQQRIQKIAIMIKPMFSNDIDISEFTIKISNGESVRILFYSNNAESIGQNRLFDHPIWDKTPDGTFSFIVTHDRDNSLVEYDTLDDNTDMAYIIIKLPVDYYMKKGDTLIVQLFPSSGITKTTLLEAPLPMKSVVSFDI